MRSLLHITLTLILTSFFSLCFAQKDNIDSLKKILPSLKDTARVDCIQTLWVIYMHNRIKDSAVFYNDLGYEESKKIGYTHGIAAAFTQKAYMAATFNGNFLLSEQMCREALKWFELTPNKKGIGYTYNFLTGAIIKRDNSDDALVELQRLYAEGRKTSNDLLVHNCLESLTSVYRERGDYDSLVAAQHKLIQDDRSFEGDREYTTHELWVMGVMYMLLEEYPTAMTFWRQLFMVDQGRDFTNIDNEMEYANLLTLANQPDSALYYYNQIDTSKADIIAKASFLLSKGEYYLYLKDFNGALRHFLKALMYIQQFHPQIKLKTTLLDIAKTYSALHICDSAITYARRSLMLSIQSKSKPLIRDAYQILSTAYDQLEKPDSANLYFKKYITAKDSVLNDQTKGRFATYNYQQKIASLNKERILQNQKLQQEKTNRKILIGALVIGLLLAAFLVRNIQLKRRKDQLQHLMTEANTQLENRRKEQQLAEMQQQKSELEMQALRAQMNPHFIFNSLNSINMFILENNKLRASEYLSKFSRLVRLILQNSQEALIPLERELEALQLYLELESLRFENKFEYSISVHNDVDTTVLKVPPLIIQPYVENSIWHGLMHKNGTGHIQIEIYGEGNTLFCQITDDGVGRKKAEELRSRLTGKHKSTGIKITETRIAMMQMNSATSSVEIKDLVLADGAAAGTEVTLKIPATIG